MRRSARAAMAAIVLAGTFPASAQALTITASSTLDGEGFRRVRVQVAGTAAAENVDIGVISGGVRISVGVGTFDLSGECTQTTVTQAECSGFLERVSGDLGGGDDGASLSADTSGGGPYELRLGEGDDFLGAGVRSFNGVSWSFDGGPGNDRLLGHGSSLDRVRVFGGAGNDQLEGTPNDVLDAGDGDDIVDVTRDHDFGLTAGSVAGGPGRDVVVAGQPRVALGLVLSGGVVSLGGGDGGTEFPSTTSGLEGMGTGSSVEQARLEGDDGPNALFGCGGATLIGNGGDDLLYGNRRASDHDDHCSFTNAPNRYSGGAGADDIGADNSIAETVECGPGVDTQVRADPTDTLVDCEATGISFTSAPSGFVAGDAATFAWEAPAAPPGSSFECSLDEGAFVACTSPRTLTGLAQGEHGFRVRVISAGQPGPPAEQRWTVDTIRPTVIFTQIPPADGNPTDVDVAWEANEPATFVCSEDGRPPAPCSSPARVVGLGPGSHSFSVLATDRAGNVADPALASWIVGTTSGAPAPPAPVTCPVGTQATVTIGLISARALTEDACFRPAPEISPTALRARGPVLVNGMRITPRAGAFTVDRTVGGGELGTTGPWTFGLGRVNLDINTPLGLGGLASVAQQVLQRNVQILTRDTPKAFGLPLRGSIGLEFSTDNGGQSKATFNVQLPNLFRGTPDGGGQPGAPSGPQGVTVEVAATASNDRGVFFSGRGRLDTLWLFGKLKLKNLEIAVDQGAGTFSGSVGISLKDSTGGPPAPSLGGDAVFTASVEVGPNGLFGTELRKLSMQASELSVKVHPIVFLQRVGAELSAAEIEGRPFAILSGNAGISFGPKLEIPPLFDGEVASIDGTIRLSVPAFLPPENFSIEVEGIGKLIEFQVAQARVKYTTPSRVDMNGRLDLTAGGFGALAEIRSSWFDGETSQFNVEAFGALRVPGLGLGQGLNLEAEAVLSSRGYAVCAGSQGERFGFGRLWGGASNTFVNSCDLGGFRAGAAQAGGARALSVKPGTRVLTVAARGGSAPPKAELTGPGGVRLATPEGPEPVRTAAGLVVQDPERNTTWFVLRRPAAGTWRVAGSTVTRVDVADPLPPVSLRVRVSGRGARRTLSWRGLPAGHRLVLNELGSGTSQVVLRTGRARGRTTITPAAGPGRARRLVATVTRGGLPRLEQNVARYTAAPPPKLRRASGLRRTGNTIRWRAQPAASRYAVSLLLANGSTVTRTLRTARTTVPAAGRRGTVVITIVALAADGRTGPAARATLRARR